MKVITVNGSPRKHGNTTQALGLMARELEAQGIEVEALQVGHLEIHGCIACGYCFDSEGNRCVFKDDIVNEAAQKLRQADGFILASPTYYSGIAGPMKAFLDRVFFSSSSYFRHKVAASVAVVRRAGGVEVVNQLNNYLQLAQTVITPTQYWPVAYGMERGEILQDAEGIQTLRLQAAAMAWLLKVIHAGTQQFPAPAAEGRTMTNFIRMPE